MSSAIFRAVILSSAAVATISGAEAAAKSSDEFAVDAASPDAVLITKAPWWQPAPSMKSAFKLVVDPYDAEAEKLRGVPFGGATVFEAQQKKMFDGYLARRVKPGRWVVESYSQQDLWALCFNAKTVQFEVRPGEVVYLGQFDAWSHRATLIGEVLRSGKTQLRGSSFADFFDLPAGPAFAPIDDLQLSDLRASIAARYPMLTATVRAVNFTPARFGTGSTLFAERRCGGYFSESAKRANAVGS